MDDYIEKAKARALTPEQQHGLRVRRVERATQTRHNGWVVLIQRDEDRGLGGIDVRGPYENRDDAVVEVKTLQSNGVTALLRDLWVRE